jgi:hypothetical protein
MLMINTDSYAISNYRQYSILDDQNQKFLQEAKP